MNEQPEQPAGANQSAEQAPPPPPGYAEEAPGAAPEPPPQQVRYEPGTLAPMSAPPAAVNEQMQAINAKLNGEQATLDNEIDTRRASEAKWVPGSTTLDREWKAHEARIDADVPTEEANQAARAAGEVGELADGDRRALEHEITGSNLATAERLADDAIAAGFSTTQDAVNAQQAYNERDPMSAQAADAQAQADLHRGSQDLAELDELRKQAEEGSAPSQH